MKIIVGLAGVADNNYGISRTNFTDDDRLDYIYMLINSGILRFDAAETYGTIHSVLAKVKEKFIFDTKFSNDPKLNVSNTLKKLLHLKDLFPYSLSTIYFHNVGYQYLNEKWFESLFNLMARYKVELRLGVSIYSKYDIDFFAKFAQICVVQVPASILDISNIIYAKKCRSDWDIVVRSIFLRGYLFSPESFSRDALSSTAALEFNKDYKNLVAQETSELEDLTISYFNQLSDVNYFIVGSRSTDRLVKYKSLDTSQIIIPNTLDNCYEKEYTNAKLWRV